MVAKTITIITLGALCVIGLVFILRMPNTPEQSTAALLRIGDTVVPVELARTREEQLQGLSNRASLPANTGMLFMYNTARIWNFWMKDMRFPLDVVWIADGKVVGTQENIPYQSEDGGVVRFQSNKPADMVLEVNAGWVAEHGITAGNTAVLDTNSN